MPDTHSIEELRTTIALLIKERDALYARVDYLNNKIENLRASGWIATPPAPPAFDPRMPGTPGAWTITPDPKSLRPLAQLAAAENDIQVLSSTTPYTVVPVPIGNATPATWEPSEKEVEALMRTKVRFTREDARDYLIREKENK